MNGATTVVGVNVPWLGVDYGHDLGRNLSFPDWPVDFDVSRTAALFAMLRAHGVRLVRFWLFEDGEGLIFDETGRVTGLDSLFVANLSTLVEIARRNDIRFYWTLLDANSVRRRPDTVTRLALTEPLRAREFFANALAPLLPLIAKDAWGVDICNEPEAMVRGDWGNRTGLGYTWWELTPCLSLLAALLREALPEALISVGSGFQGHRTLTSGKYLDLGLNALDFHDHSYAAVVPSAYAVSQTDKVVIGELGRSMPEDLQPTREAWLDAQTKLRDRLYAATQIGMTAVFLWFVADQSSTDPHSLVYRHEVGPALHAIGHLQKSGAIRTV